MCTVAAGAGTIFRNYFAPVDGQPGQREDRQIDCLREIGVAPCRELIPPLWKSHFAHQGLR